VIAAGSLCCVRSDEALLRLRAYGREMREKAEQDRTDAIERVA
jgi:hypothetical protein